MYMPARELHGYKPKSRKMNYTDTSLSLAFAHLIAGVANVFSYRAISLSATTKLSMSVNSLEND